jgi:hypothetical protein
VGKVLVKLNSFFDKTTTSRLPSRLKVLGIGPLIPLFPRSSATKLDRLPIEEGMEEESLASGALKTIKFGQEAMEDGITPDIEVDPIYNSFKLVSPPIPSKLPDMSVLPATPRTWSEDSEYKPDGRAPVRKLFSSLRICNAESLETDEGIGPVRAMLKRASVSGGGKRCLEKENR